VKIIPSLRLCFHFVKYNYFSLGFL